ncbi:DUF1634 domain-containing protein [Thermanaerosceptrum fracticalcis]|uniref:DUF1634 domain-containing protein n=1 Tax=Thermanaerosceptrum fracticalcis TaxID=1712410 RepID=A0A7G6DYX0_THEFR|nr:DUF1634 domain-containing protein [Thermanaerosceptrum fracticalcis]QNB45024.1 DUF1634 domain-containing protein [Thermanaerosceptrum fracticalcis]
MGKDIINTNFEDRDKKLFSMELFISNALRIGVLISGIVVSAGLIMALLNYKEQAVFPHTLREIWQGLISVQPYSVIDLGLIFLIFTPVFRVIASIFLFLHEKDYLYSAITIFVLFMLILSFTLGKVG